MNNGLTSSEIGPQLNIGILLSRWPESAEILEGFGLNCSQCGGARHETLLQGARNHGLDVQALVGALQAGCRQSNPEEKG